MKKLMKRAAAVLLSLAMLGGALPFEAGTFPKPAPALTAQAADSGSTATLDATTGVLTLSGNVVKADVRAFNDGRVTSVVAAPGTVLPADCSLMFYLFRAQSIDLSNADTSNVTNMHSIFSMCTKVTSINLSGIDTSHVTDMSDMFWFNTKLTSLAGITEFDTSNVTDMNGMFGGCEALQTLDLSSFHTSNVTNMNYMFGDCEALQTLDLRRFDTSKVTDMSKMFSDCKSLAALDLSSFDTSKVTDMSEMFIYDYNLQTIIVSGKWNTSNITEGTDMFKYSSNLVGGNGTTYSEDHITYEYAQIDTPEAPGYFTKAVTVVLDETTGKLTLRDGVNKTHVRAFCKDIRVKSVYAEPGTVFPADCTGMFDGYYYATEFDLSKADTSNVTNMRSMFKDCKAAYSINTTGWDTSKVTDMSWMFENCGELETIEGIQGWNTDSAETLCGMFYYCSDIAVLELGTELAANDPYADAWKTDNVVDYSYMFNYCFNLEYLMILNFTLPSGSYTAESMFGSTDKLWYIYFFRNFEVTEEMGLPNNEDGWTYFGGDYVIRRISGDGTYAVMPAQPDRISACSQLSRYTKVDYSAFHYNTIAFAGSMPYPGSIVVGTSWYEGEQCTVDYKHSGWYDADNDRFLAQGEAMNFNGAYVYIVKLEPKSNYYFTNPTPAQIAALKIPYLYDPDHNFLKPAAAHLNDDGTLDVYAVLRNPAMIDCSTGIKSIAITDQGTGEMILPEGTVFVGGFGGSSRDIKPYKLPCFSIAENHSVSSTSIRLNEAVAVETVNDDYLNYVVKEKGYEISIDGVNYKDMKTVLENYQPFTGLKPSTEYTLRVRLKGEDEPFFTQKITTEAAKELTNGGYIDSELYPSRHMNITFSHNVALNNNLGIVYYIPKSELEGCENVKLILQKEQFNENGSVRTIASEELTSYIIENSGYGDEYVFEYNNIAAKEMGSKVYATVYAEKDGKSYISQIDEYSVSTYALNKLNKSSTKAALKTLLVDMLNYGAAAQTYFNYNTGHLANSSLTAEQKKLGTSASSLNITSDVSETAISSPKAQFTGKNLLLGNNVALVFYMTFDSSVNKNNVTLELIYTTVKGEAVIKTVPFSQMKVSGYAAGEYEYDFLDIRAKDACRPVTARILLNGNQISSKITYSVQSYAYNKLNKSTTSAELKTIIHALMVYCKSAENYFSANAV